MEEKVLYDKLQKHFGYSKFRPLQKDIIKNVLEGKDAVVLMPTGGGKSICYQLPSVILDGITLVVSPLIALMKDQVQSLRANGIEAVFINSSLKSDEKKLIIEKIINKKADILYISPETIFSGSFIEFLQSLEINLIAVDEAHCVSSWGHDFRPKYKELSRLKALFPNIPFIALTATADRAVRSDIGDMLAMNHPQTFISSFDRPNLSLAVLPGLKKWEQILQIVNRYKNKSGIIYCSSRKATETIANKLKKAGFNAENYHAGMDSLSREQTQDQFIAGDIDIMCATVAFGMGIDKSDIRFVIHHNMPGNLESYYQEIGRAGRDGEPAETILFYSYRDVQTQMSFIDAIANEKYKKIQLEKLKRMQEYAESQICRRKVLLSYFSESQEEDCGNCDVCKNPPKYLDGKIHAQKALSAIVRTNQQIGLTTLIDILKGVYSIDVKAKSYHQIKTFGLGKDITNFAWQLYIQQFIQQGFIEVDYKENYTLKLNALSQKVLKGEHKVKLIDYEVIKKRQEEQKKTASTVKKSKAPVEQTLFEHIRELRNKIAKEQGKPAFVIFSNETIKDMASQKPSNEEEFLSITGVGEFKAEQFGEIFLKAIAEFRSGKTKGDTFKATLELYKQGKTIDEIASERNLQKTTIYSHLAKLLETEKSINIFDLISKQELELIKTAKKTLNNPDGLKPYFDFFSEEIEYGKLRIALNFLNFDV